MWQQFQTALQEPGIFSTAVRLLLALVLGGILGFERGRKRRPAGLRTYVVVCVASALVMLTGDHLARTFGSGDPARLGAQVISGIGFLGAGTIIITSRQVKGLTTAAGLWAAACMGLAVGAGFYAGALLCGALLLVVMTTMSRIETFLRDNSRQINFFAEFRSMEALGKFITKLRESGYIIYDVEINRGNDTVSDLVGATFWAALPAPESHVLVIQELSCLSGVKYLEELGSL
ncbi:MAG TPA: MgtC/SapB family protein [Candidatus Fournierella excrementavium]|nr:MgtC/SapB family protein [Candidatus Fournierella excrementavium]